MVPGVAFSSAAWIVASGVVGECPVGGVAPVRTDVERRLRGDGCGARRRRRAAVLCLPPVEENDGHGRRASPLITAASTPMNTVCRCGVRLSGVGPTDEVFHSSCDVPGASRPDGGRGVTGGLHGPGHPALKLESFHLRASSPCFAAALIYRRRSGEQETRVRGPWARRTGHGPEVPEGGARRTPLTSPDSPRATTRTPERGRRGGGGFHPDVASHTVTLHREYRSNVQTGRRG